MARGELPAVTWEAIIDHIDHAVKVAGVITWASDPTGSWMPCRRKGYSEQDVTKILGGNILRVMEAVERLAATSANALPSQNGWNGGEP
jgi:membrane dipeptidase